MNLSNVSNIRFNGSDVKLAKINGVIVYKKESENPLLKARYTVSESGIVPKFNTNYTYDINEVDNGDGTYTIELTSEYDFKTVSFQSLTQLLSVDYLKVTSSTTTMNTVFTGCSSLTSVNTSGWDTSKVSTFQYIFYNCSSLTSVDVSSWDTSNSITFQYMFYNCSSLTSVDVSSWNTSKVTGMKNMFFGCSSLTSVDASSWDTSKVTDMSQMFYNCNLLTSVDASSWDTSKVTGMNQIFYNCNSLTSLDSMLNITTNLSLPESLNEESVLDVIDNLATVTTTQTLKMSATQLSWIPEDKISEANSKGWTISA